MQVVYHFWSATTPDWLRVIADGLSRDDPRAPSTFLWQGAEWMEREAYDMFGIIFEGNRDLRRIFMPPDYVSFPLRKDFFLPDDVARSPGAGVRHVEQPPRPDAPDRHGPPRCRRSDDQPSPSPLHPPTIPGSCSTSRSACSSRSRPTRRERSARRSSTPSATARCSSTWAPTIRRPTG